LSKYSVGDGLRELSFISGLKK